MKTTTREIERLLDLVKKYKALGIAKDEFSNSAIFIQLSEKWFAVGKEINDGTKALMEQLGFEPRMPDAYKYVCTCEDLLHDIKEKVVHFQQPTNRILLPAEPKTPTEVGA